MNQKVENELVYIPRRDKGLHLFDGKPCFTQKAFDIIGDEGVQHIDKVMQSMLECRKKMFGVSEKIFYGFTNPQTFLHLPSKSVIILRKYNKSDCPYNQNELVDPEIAEEDNFYIIDFQRIINMSKRSIKILLSGGYHR